MEAYEENKCASKKYDRQGGKNLVPVRRLLATWPRKNRSYAAGQARMYRKGFCEEAGVPLETITIRHGVNRGTRSHEWKRMVQTESTVA